MICISKKIKIGYIYSGSHKGKEDKLFLRLAQKNNIDLVMLNISKNLDEDKLEDSIKKCKIVFNNTAEDYAYEITKTIEQLGTRVIDRSDTNEYTEDKWMFFVICKEHKIPTIKTILLSENLNIAKKQLKDFNEWPVVLKRIYGTMGEFVKKADDINEAIQVIKSLWKKGSVKRPIIAQQMILSPSYRVTTIDRKIVQGIIKKNNGWKATGVFSKKFETFRLDKDLKKLIAKVIRVVKINICGIDLLKNKNQWLVLEVNSEPALDFIEEEHEKLVKLVINFLKRECKKKELKKKRRHLE